MLLAARLIHLTLFPNRGKIIGPRRFPVVLRHPIATTRDSLDVFTGRSSYVITDKYQDFQGRNRSVPTDTYRVNFERSRAIRTDPADRTLRTWIGT